MIYPSGNAMKSENLRIEILLIGIARKMNFYQGHLSAGLHKDFLARLA